eukprot:s285_g11.t1
MRQSAASLVPGAVAGLESDDEGLGVQPLQLTAQDILAGRNCAETNRLLQLLACRVLGLGEAHPQWVGRWRLRYQVSGEDWQWYDGDFEGNSCTDKVHIIQLPKPLRADKLRICPEEWHTRPALRLEEVRPSLLERFFAKYEFTCQYQLSCSDCQTWSTQEDSSSLGYTESLGHPLLLQAIWDRYLPAVQREETRRGGGELPREVGKQNAVKITACVPVEGIFIAMTQLLERGDVVIAMEPAYQALTEIARSRGCEIISWKPHYDAENFWNFRLEDLQFLLKKMYTAILGEEGEAGPPSNVGRRNSIVLSGLSKPWGMPGLRMGWLIMENGEHFEKVLTLRDYTTMCLPHHSEILSIIALQEAEAFLKRNRQICDENYRLLQEFLLRMSDWFYPLVQENQAAKSPFPFRASTVFPRLKHPLAGLGSAGALESPSALAEHLASEYSICMIVSEKFEFDCPAVRFGIGMYSFPKSLKMLEEALKDIRSKAEMSG